MKTKKPALRAKVVKTRNGYEAIVKLPNLLSTKLLKDDNTTEYKNLRNLYDALDNLAEKYDLGYVGAFQFMEDSKKFAAKKSPIK